MSSPTSPPSPRRPRSWTVSSACPRPSCAPSCCAPTPETSRSDMAGETTITVIGNLTGDPELRFTPSGAAVANFTVASTPRTFDRQSNEWKDGETLFMRCSVWREVAENVAESLHRGTRVIVTGRLEVAVLRDQGRREAHRHRDGGRRGRPLAALCHDQGQPHPAQRRRRLRRWRRPAGGPVVRRLGQLRWQCQGGNSRAAGAVATPVRRSGSRAQGGNQGGQGRLVATPATPVAAIPAATPAAGATPRPMTNLPF
jgi:single-strand DNA-binding protein